MKLNEILNIEKNASRIENSSIMEESLQQTEGAKKAKKNPIISLFNKTNSNRELITKAKKYGAKK